MMEKKDAARMGPKEFNAQDLGPNSKNLPGKGEGPNNGEKGGRVNLDA